MRKHIAISCLGALLGLAQIAAADGVGDNDRRNVEKSSSDHVDTNTSLYPKAWCIQTYLSASPRAAGVSRRAPPPIERMSRLTGNGVAADAPVAALAASDYTDRSSLMERLKALKSKPLATLWQGRDTALVLRVQNGGYFGVSIDDTRYDAD